MGENLRLDELLGAENPRDTPTGKAETLGKAVNDEDVVLVNILDVLGGGDGGAVTAARVVVTRVKLVADEGGAATADVLDLSQLRVGDDPARGVAWVGCQDYRRTPRDLGCNVVRMDVVAVLLGERRGDGGKLDVC